MSSSTPSEITRAMTRAFAKSRWNPWLVLHAGLFILAGLLLASMWSVSLARLQHERTLVIDHARVSQQNLAGIIAENLRQVLDRGVLYSSVADGWFHASPRTGEANLANLLAGDRTYNRMAIFNLQGHELFASSPHVMDTDQQAALHDFLSSGAGNTLPALRVAPLSRAYGEAWHAPLLLPLSGPEGGLRGALMLHLDLGYLLRLYQDIDIGANGVIQIFEEHGIELARARRSGLEMGDSSKIVNPLPKDGSLSGTRSAPLFKAMSTYLISHHSLGDYPFTVTVNQPVEDILAEYRARRDKDIMLMSLLTAIALLLTVGVGVMVSRQRLYFETVARSEKEKKLLIEQLEDEKRRAYELASRDHLTGLANRRMFMQLAASHLARARRSRQHYALMFLDLDRFKSINDTLGHKVGDLLLRIVAQRLRETLRESDVIARFGGDEFVILVTGLEHETDVVGIAEKLVEIIRKPCLDLDGHDVQVGPSIGVALFPRDGQDLDTLIRHADIAMYQSKKLSRGSFTFFDQSLNTHLPHAFDLEQRLPKAIEDGEFVLHFQPKVETEGFRTVGFEALIRWQHPEHGLIFPNDFIPLAEGNGQILALGQWIIEAACRELAAWRADGLPLLPIAVNISARQLRDTGLPAYITERLAAHNLEPRLLQVEVTESSLVENIEIARGILDELVAAGIGVALDDFGNGFSSLGYIKTLPIDTIKIDRGFIRDIQNSPDDAIIVESTIILAHKLGLRVVAEGVETSDQVVYLKNAGCDLLQGYYFSRPIPREQVRGMLLHPMKEPS
ncbi:MAG: putative bifunctional diguanylate cyclase/phosphodiesterase [Pseudomonadota bacterium]